MIETRQTRRHRGHRIVAQLGEAWVGVVHAPDSAIVGQVDGASAQEAMVRGVDVVNDRLSGRTTS